MSVQRALEAAIAARIVIEEALEDEKDLTSRTKQLSGLAGALGNLFKKAEKS